MLVLTRRSGEAVCIGRDVEVFVLSVTRGRVKLGFRAPRDVVVHRTETALSTVRGSCSSLSSASARPRLDCDELSLAPPLRLFRKAGGV